MACDYTFLYYNTTILQMCVRNYKRPSTTNKSMLFLGTIFNYVYEHETLTQHYWHEIKPR